jgi:putative transcriptional regulator
MSNLPSKLTNNIKVLRTKLNFTQEELAKKTNCSRQTISAIEKNRYSPSLLLAYKISYILKASIDEVFGQE